MSEPANYNDYFPKCKSPVSFCEDSCQEMHRCSKVPDYIFYKLATSNGWTIRSAGQALLVANMIYWQDKNLTMQDAGCGVGKAVDEMSINGGDVDAVIAAWAAGGIDIASCVPRKKSKPGSSEILRVKNCELIPSAYFIAKLQFKSAFL